jgi:hypothetical protein
MSGNVTNVNVNQLMSLSCVSAEQFSYQYSPASALQQQSDAAVHFDDVITESCYEPWSTECCPSASV